MQHLLLVTATHRYSLSTKLSGNISDKLSSIFSVHLPSEPEWQSYISWWNHVWRPELHQNIRYLSPISLASTELSKIPWKHRNSAEMGKFRSSAKNSAFCRKLWSLLIAPCIINCDRKQVGTGIGILCCIGAQQMLPFHSSGGTTFLRERTPWPHLASVMRQIENLIL